MLYDIERDFGPCDLTVLVVDRHPFARAALTALLSHDGYRVFQAHNLPTSVSRIHQIHDLAVLIVDLETAEWRSIVHHAVKTTGALVIAMEGNHPFSEMYDLKMRGVQICLKKPVTYSDIRKAIQQKFGMRNGSESARDEGAAAAIPSR